MVCGADLHEVGLRFGFLEDRDHRVDEAVERFLALGLGGLDQQALGHQQREVGRRRMEAVVEQALGEIHRGDAELARLAASA